MKQLIKLIITLAFINVTVGLFIIVPSFLEDPYSAKLMQARAALKTIIHPEQLFHDSKTFQFLDNLPSANKLKTGHSFNYIVFLSYNGTWVSDKTIQMKDGENFDQHYIAFAWPKKWGTDGDVLLAITEDGKLYETNAIKVFPLELFDDGVPLP